MMPLLAEQAAGLVESAEPAAAGGVDLQVLALLAAVFVLSVFVGLEVIVKVPPTLHTPLMSGANAISGITVVGALAAAGSGAGGLAAVLGFAALVLATVNVVGGFLVTHRMLRMFRPGGGR
jgi:NAD(P) transhydrogenase subunit alpha